MKLWTAILTHDGELMDAFDQDQWVCGGGPNVCGGCLDCVVAQCGDDFDIRYDLTIEQVRALAPPADPPEEEVGE